MVQISIDDKPMVFESPKPEKVRDLVAIVGKFLFENGRVIQLIVVDGEDGTTDSGILERCEYREVKFYSVDFNQNMIEEISHIIGNREGIVSFMDEFSINILNSEWESNANRSNNLSEITLTIVVLLNRTYDLLSDNYSELLEEIKLLLHRFKLATNLYTSAAAFRDSGCISDVIVNQLSPTIKQALNLLQGPVKSYFDVMMGSNSDAPA